MECALQIYWKFGWICSHPVKSRVKKFVISPTFVLGYVSVFSLHPDWLTTGPRHCLCGYTCHLWTNSNCSATEWCSRPTV